jgi:hypothetical protein
VEESIPKLKSALGESVDTGISKFQKGLDDAQSRMRGAAMDFIGDIEKKWEERLAKETKEQFRLLNRVLLYTLVMAVVSLLYAIARKKLGL